LLHAAVLLLLASHADAPPGANQFTDGSNETSGIAYVDLTNLSAQRDLSHSRSEYPIRQELAATPGQNLHPTSLQPLAADEPVTPFLTEPTASAEVMSREASPNATPEGDTSDIWSQIEKCLPTGNSPIRENAKLTMAFDSNGNLTIAPIISFNNHSATESEIVIANEIVAAALQCGPYPNANGTKEIAVQIDNTKN